MLLDRRQGEAFEIKTYLHRNISTYTRKNTNIHANDGRFIINYKWPIRQGRGKISRNQRQHYATGTDYNTLAWKLSSTAQSSPSNATISSTIFTIFSKPLDCPRSAIEIRLNLESPLEAFKAARACAFICLLEVVVCNNEGVGKVFLNNSNAKAAQVIQWYEPSPGKQTTWHIFRRKDTPPSGEAQY